MVATSIITSATRVLLPGVDPFRRGRQPRTADHIHLWVIQIHAFQLFSGIRRGPNRVKWQRRGLPHCTRSRNTHVTKPMRSAAATRAMRRLSSVALAFFLISAADHALGHGVRLPFDQWGGFSPATVRCQRVIARSAGQCALTAWQLRRGCRDAVLRGGTCDEAATTAAIVAARLKSLDTIERYCSERQAIDLQYLSLSFDLPQDVIDFCRSWETAADSAVYGPIDRSGVPPPAQLACVAAAADSADALMQRVFRSRRQCMDRIADLPLTAPTRTALLGAVAQRVADANAVLASRLAARCSAEQFAALYGRAPAVFIDSLSTRADCIGARFYIQDAVLCPAPICGNGIIEEPETCDDANTVDGDGCPSTCELP